MESQQYWEEGTEVSHTPSAPAPTQLPPLPAPPPECYTCHIGSPASTHCCCPRRWFTLGVTLGGVPSVGVDTWRVACAHHYSVMHCSSTALKVLSTLPVHPPLSPNSWQSVLFFLQSPQFCLFQNVIQLESYRMWPFQIGFFHLVICIYVFKCLFPIVYC